MSKIEHLTAYDIEQLPTVTLIATGEKLPVLQIDGATGIVTAIKNSETIEVSFDLCEGWE